MKSLLQQINMNLEKGIKIEMTKFVSLNIYCSKFAFTFSLFAEQCATTLILCAKFKNV